MLEFYGIYVDSLLMLGMVFYFLFWIMVDVFVVSGVGIVIVSLCCEVGVGQDFYVLICDLNLLILFNIVGCYFVCEVVIIVQMVCELFDMLWIKLEVICDDDMLCFDVVVLIEVVCILFDDGFQVFFYCIEDLLVCGWLLDVGCQVLMFWGVFIGLGWGLNNLYGLCSLCVYFCDVFLVVDVGIGLFSYVVQVMELGYDVVFLNIVVVKVGDLVGMVCVMVLVIEVG